MSKLFLIGASYAISWSDNSVALPDTRWAWQLAGNATNSYKTELQSLCFQTLDTEYLGPLPFPLCTLIYVGTENDGAVQNSPPCQMHHCFCSHPNLQIMDGVSGSDGLWQVSLFKHMLTYKNSKMTTCMAIFFFVKSGRTNYREFSSMHHYL